MNRDQLDGLLALKLVADKKSFTAAASELGISPSAVSQGVRQLERRVGVALLARTTRSTSLTEAGERFLSQAGPAIEQLLGALNNVGSFAEKPSGLLRLNLPRSIYLSFLAPLIESFIRKHPEVSVELFFEDAQSDTVGQGFDAGIRISDILAKDMVALKLVGPVRFVAAGAPKYFNKRDRPKHPKDLLAHNCVRLRLGSSLYDKWEFQQKGKEFQVQVKGSLISNDLVLMLDAVANGAGIIYATESAIRGRVNSGDLEVVLSQFACTSDGFYLYYPSRSQALPKLRAFVEHIKSARKVHRSSLLSAGNFGGTLSGF